MLKAVLSSVLVLSMLVLAIAQERYVRPVDEGNKDPSFAAFRSNLIAAAERHDATYIYKIVDRRIQLSFGGDAGIADFKRMWKIERRDSKFWEVFLTVLRNGGSFSKVDGQKTKLFFAPYSFDSFPADLDAFEYMLVFGKNVNLRERPDASSSLVASLSYNVVKPDFDKSLKVKDGYSWLSVETLGGKRGFIKSEFVRSSIDYRAGFEKKNGVWKMTVFLEGD